MPTKDKREVKKKKKEKVIKKRKDFFGFCYFFFFWIENVKTPFEFLRETIECLGSGGSTVVRKAETWRNWRKGTTRCGICGLIRLNTGKLTRSGHSEDWQIEDLSWFCGWWCMAVLSSWNWSVCLIAITNETFVY